MTSSRSLVKQVVEKLTASRLHSTELGLGRVTLSLLCRLVQGGALDARKKSREIDQPWKIVFSRIQPSETLDYKTAFQISSPKKWRARKWLGTTVGTYYIHIFDPFLSPFP